MSGPMLALLKAVFTSADYAGFPRLPTVRRGSRYMPHQGEREKARRRRQMAKAARSAPDLLDEAWAP